MTSARVRVFVSHSAKEEDAKAVQDALVAEFEKPERAARFGLLLDQITLEPGDMWRSRINLWVGGCDAAVVLLSESALKSAYVAYEVSILSYRVAMGDSLLLIPVLLGEVSPADLQKTLLSPAQLAELQVTGQGKTAEEIALEVVSTLEKKDLVPGKTPIEKRARQLVKELKFFDQEDLEEAAALLDCCIDEWIPRAEDKLRLRLAIQLLSVGMEHAVESLLSLRGRLPPTMTDQQQVKWMERVLNHVASSWVDTRSIEVLPDVAKGGATAVAVGSSARHIQTFFTYVDCAKHQDQFPGTWYRTTCDGVVGEDSVEAVATALVGKLKRTLATALCTTSDDVCRVLEKMNSMYRQAIIVALPGAGMSDEILEALRGELPYVTFFLLLGDLNMADLQLSDRMMKLLIPELASEDEARFLETFEGFKETVWIRPESEGRAQP